MSPSAPRRGAAWLAAGAAVLAALAGCGGGGSGGSSVSALPATANNGAGTTSPAPISSGNSALLAASLAARCAAPRYGIDPSTGAAFPDRPASLEAEKAWVRAWIDQTYLWYAEVPPFAAAGYATPVAYFNVLKTPLPTASGRAKDRFHFSENTAAYQAASRSGVALGYGFAAAVLNALPPRDVRIAYTEPGSPAVAAGVARGQHVVEIDGIDVKASSNVAGLNAALLPQSAGEVHSFRLQAPDGSEQLVSLAAASIRSTPVQSVKTIATPSGPVGYLLFNDHTASAEAQLIAAINQLQAAAVGALVLDMRYNGGGLLDVASELAYMVGPAAASADNTFERLVFNDRNPFALNATQASLRFHDRSLGFSAPAGQPLPKLGLPRISVLTGPDTCSASESVVNSLRGIGATVDLIGAATCGKPYGFYPQDNCGTTYFSIQFQGVNQQGFGDYGDGFAPTCAVADDFDHALGDPAEARLAAALNYRASGACAVVAQSKSAQARLGSASPAAAPGAASAQVAEDTPYLLLRSPARTNRIIDPPAF
jgi:carboxyl-terminal processing protease